MSVFHDNLAGTKKFFSALQRLEGSMSDIIPSLSLRDLRRALWRDTAPIPGNLRWALWTRSTHHSFWTGFSDTLSLMTVLLMFICYKVEIQKGSKVFNLENKYSYNSI